MTKLFCFAGYVAQRFGRKRGLLIVAVPIAVHYVCLAVADAVWVLYLGRIIAGFGIGWTFTVLPMYTGEVSEVSTKQKLWVPLPYYWGSTMV